MYLIYFLIYLIGALCYTKLSNYFLFFFFPKEKLTPFIQFRKYSYFNI